MGGYENKMRFYVRYYFILYPLILNEKQQAISHTFHIPMLYCPPKEVRQWQHY